MTMLTRRRAILAGGVCAAVLLLTPVRASAQSITTDFDKKANFAVYKTYSVDRILIGMLMVDVIDAQGKNLLWRATASDTLSDNPQKNEKKIHKAVEKMFEKYPTAGK